MLTLEDDTLSIFDFDGEKLEVGEVGGFGEKMLALFVISADDENDLNDINLNVENAIKLRDRLTKFIEKE